jgi:hypothetical protein
MPGYVEKLYNGSNIRPQPDLNTPLTRGFHHRTV